MPEPGTAGSMTDQLEALPAPTPDHAATAEHSIQRRISQIALNTPGVVRLEPTLSTSGPKLLVHHDRADGVQIRNRNNMIEIDINIATQTGQEARQVARVIHNNVTAEIAKLGRLGTIKVNVLTIEDTES